MSGRLTFGKHQSLVSIPVHRCCVVDPPQQRALILKPNKQDVALPNLPHISSRLRQQL